MDEVQCPPSINYRKEKKTAKVSEHPLNEAGPPTSPGSRTPPYLQNKKKEKGKKDKRKPEIKIKMLYMV